MYIQTPENRDIEKQTITCLFLNIAIVGGFGYYPIDTLHRYITLISPLDNE